ncbi:MAG: hypothetical protein GX067_01020 [Clostridiales bacterium]|jgi:hypothetical protein|nr:hypothetical protein [Clostridiales bacterium]
MYINQISLRYDITRAQLLMRTIPAEIRVDTVRNGIQINSHPLKIKIDNSDFFKSIGIKPVPTVLQDSAVKGKKAVLDYMARQTREKNAKLGPNAKTVAEIANTKPGHIWSKLDFIPKEGPHIGWEDGYVDIIYKKDERIVNITPAKIEFQYIPYKVEIYAEKWMKEYPPQQDH